VKQVIPADPQRILLIRLKGIGDVILSTPLLRALRKKFPKAQLHFLTRSFCAPILKGNPYLDQLIVHPEKSAPFGEKLAFFRKLRDANYDWVLDLAAEPRSAWLTLATGAPLRAGYAFRIRKWAFNFRIPKNKVRKYQGEVNLDILRAVGVPAEGNQTEIYLDPEEKEWAEKTLAGPDFAGLKWKIGLNPTGTWSSKRWPAVYWKELAEKIHANLGVKPILLGGPGDESLLDEIRSGMEGKILLKPATTLRQAAAFVSKLDILIGNDGTPQHFAQVFGTKSLTLCGPHWGMGWVKPGDIRHRYLQ
jgi:heptosyltransferase III